MSRVVRARLMEEDSFFLWQRAVFTAGGSARSKADSLRLRISLLEQMRQLPAGYGEGELLRSAIRQYGDLMDDQDLHKGNALFYFLIL